MRRWYPIALVTIAIALSLALYPRLPERIPTHWNASGEVDGYGSKALGTVLMPGVMLMMMLVFPLIPKLDPRQANYAKFEGTFHIITNAVLTFMFGVHCVMLGAALGAPVPVSRAIPFGVGILLATLGNVLPRTRPNWTIGIRTPWTLSSDRVWERTHRVGGHLMLAGGLVIALAALVAPMRAIVPIFAGAIFVTVGGAFAYSYAAWRQEQRP